MGIKYVEVVKGHRLDYQLYKYLLQYFSDSELTEILNSVRTPPTRYYVRVNTLRIEPQDLIARLRSRGLEVNQDENLSEAVWFPVKGPNRVPSARKVVLADKHAAESVFMGANLYVPGVIKFEQGVKRGDEVNVIAPSGDVVALGIAEVDGDEVGRVKRGIAVRTIVSAYEAPKIRELSEYEEGLIYDQSLPAQWVAHVMDPRPNEVIVDMNAAPGGKTSHIIQLTRGEAIVYAFDRSVGKVGELSENLRRLGMEGMYRAEARDSRYLDVDLPELVGRVDRVLIDPPCSDMGVRPRLFDVKTMDLVNSMANYQRQFIKVAWKLLKPGGALVYSTCTLTPMENEDNVKYAVELGFEVDKVHVPGSTRGFGDYGGSVIRFYPHIHDTPGFFIARLIKPR
ncbi:RsmB/NOP family class I SAM-dependent RNA methyltransferase [Vulcanisaeta thermophila]|uniref:RsmB/NOP family class I SAM-dependent RNA methyltransferase n=1 Tax=Vulcanisaeta thermophila TaxID=867917 RepID=UPI000853DC53|nr:RsmB/NOP family class I SAM-dependent RNA methyltransferase [Vulcanisaeta thermophila]